MNNGDFNTILMRRLDCIENTLATKAGEYAGNGDRLHNFRTAARVMGSEMDEALWGMAMKHLVSVKDMIDAPDAPTKEMADEKLGDMINYLILLEAVWEEQRKRYVTVDDGKPEIVSK